MTPGLGPVRIRRMLEAFGDAEAACKATHAQLSRLDGFGSKTAADVASGLRAARSRTAAANWTRRTRWA